LQNGRCTDGREQHSSADKNSRICKKFIKMFKGDPVINIKQQSFVIISYIVIGKVTKLPTGFSV